MITVNYNAEGDKPALAKNDKPAPSPVFPYKDNTVLSKCAVTDKDYSNFRAKNLLTDRQVIHD